jgi:sugar transferase (PEP-CTERM system associated)
MAVVKLYRKKTSAKFIFIADFIALSTLFLVSCLLYNHFYTSDIANISNADAVVHALVFLAITQTCLLAVGLYNDKLRESSRGIKFRIFCAVLIAYFLTNFVYWISPFEYFNYFHREWLFISALLILCSLRLFANLINYKSFGRRNVLILGSGRRASIIEKRMRRESDRVGFRIVGFVAVDGDSDAGISSSNIIILEEPLEQFCERCQVHEIVIAADERRNNLSLDCLFACKMNGVQISEIVDFIEKETGQIAVNLLHPSWIIHSGGFKAQQTYSLYADQIFNSFLSLVIFALTWPLMLITFFSIKVEDGLSAPILYSQIRIGKNGKPFKIFKFRSMGTDAEKDGAQWATKNDVRITKTGNIIRKYRIDELPQLINVLRGEMGFVGPRPERPKFIEELSEKIPFYKHRHNVKPGLTGWAQLQYPYGSNDADALEKLKYDLYYIKHRSLLLDLLILVRTSEIILFGKGR